MRVALIQQHCTPDRSANLARALATMDAARNAGAQLAIFAELAVERFFPQHQRLDAAALGEPIPGPLSDAVGARARATGLVTVFNMYERDRDGRWFDSSPVFDADGSLLGVTRMIHITDYACFHEKAYYHPGDRGAPVYRTRAGSIGVAICYDRHYPEYMRALALGGADLVAIPQAGALGEWPDGLFEAEVRTAAFQNGYYAALCNRVGPEDKLTFAGESFVVDPEGQVVARGKRLEDDLVVADVNLAQCAQSTARRLFWRDRRPELYRDWLG
ncbi:MAG TPA: nitrilase-related carbon-nitrogen hydrolase [Gemmatimonadales bacterium]|nr:nitrilase-related carbon-nitrogen hydrolase [Gemmatimonadales bacterium]